MKSRLLFALACILLSGVWTFAADSSFNTPAGVPNSSSGFSSPAGTPNSSSGFSTPAGAASSFSGSSSGFSIPAGAASNAIVKGEVMRVDSDGYIVRDVSGKEVRVQPGKDTKIDYVPQAGDRIEAQLTDGRPTSISRVGGANSGSGPAVGGPIGGGSPGK